MTMSSVCRIGNWAQFTCEGTLLAAAFGSLGLVLIFERAMLNPHPTPRRFRRADLVNGPGRSGPLPVADPHYSRSTTTQTTVLQ
jgi:hypothetical protein